MVGTIVRGETIPATPLVANRSQWIWSYCFVLASSSHLFISPWCCMSSNAPPPNEPFFRFTRTPELGHIPRISELMPSDLRISNGISRVPRMLSRTPAPLLTLQEVLLSGVWATAPWRRITTADYHFVILEGRMKTTFVNFLTPRTNLWEEP